MLTHALCRLAHYPDLRPTVQTLMEAGQPHVKSEDGIAACSLEFTRALALVHWPVECLPLQRLQFEANLRLSACAALQQTKSPKTTSKTPQTKARFERRMR